MSKKVALGKGIASLIRETPNQILAHSLNDVEKDKNSSSPQAQSQKDSLEDATPFLVSTTTIKTDPGQPRKIFKEKELEELAESIKENGIIQPLIVSRTDMGLELIAGERRLRAAQKIGLDKVPVIFKKHITEQDKMIMSIIENVQRSDLNCIEEALAYYRLMEEFKLTQQEVAKKLGKERSSVANFLRILKLPRDVIDLIQKDLLSFGHAKVLASIGDREKIILLANCAAKEKLSVRELEELSRKNPSGSRPKSNHSNNQYDSLRQKLEENTGFHFTINAKKNGKGQVAIKFSSEEELNSIYEFLLQQ